MVNLNFDQFSNTETKHKSAYLGTNQKQAHVSPKSKDDINSRSGTDMSVGALGRDITGDNKTE